MHIDAALDAAHRRRDIERLGEGPLHVTAALKLAGIVNTDWYTPEAAERGVAVHLATEQIDRGETPPADPRLDAYRLFIAEVQPEIVASEQIVEGDGYVGRLDRVVRIHDRLGVLDIKSGYPEPWHRLQLAGYALTFCEPMRRWSLYLRDDATYRLVEHKQRRYDDAVWRACLTLATFRREHGC